MKRRSIISLASGVSLGAALPLLAQTPGKVWRIGVLTGGLPRALFLLPAALRELGYDDGKNVIFDPNFALWLFILKRLRHPGLRIKDLPPIDIVCISHAHFDHLHKPSLRAITRMSRRKGGVRPTVIVPSHVGDLVAREKNTLPDADLTNYFQAATAILLPYTTTGLVQTVSMVAVNGTGVTNVRWTKSTGTATQIVGQPWAGAHPAWLVLLGPGFYNLTDNGSFGTGGVSIRPYKLYKGFCNFSSSGAAC